MHTGARFLFARCIHNGQGEITKPYKAAAHAQNIKEP
jgi:hypothetical protein